MSKYYPYLKEHGSKLIEQGYKIIPIPPGKKGPSKKGWPGIDADQHQLESWLENGDGKSGIGIITGEVVAIDIDVYDEEYVVKLVGYCQKHLGVAPIRVGKKPKALLVYITEKPFKKESSDLYEGLTGSAQVEILGQGQQFVAYNIHPGTEKPYKWKRRELFNIAQKDLTVITLKQALEFIDYFKANLPADFELKAKKDPKDNQREPKEKMEDPYKKLGVIGAFCRAYPIEDAINKFLDDVYVFDNSAGKYLFTGSASSPGAIVYDEGKFLHSHHTTDPAEGRPRNSFDLTRIHKFGEMDKGVEAAFNKLPSYIEMKKLAKEDELVQKELKKERAEGFEKLAEPPPRGFFMSLEQLRSKLGPINWTVENYIESNTTGSIFGDPGTFKSFLALDMSLHIACGIPWHGNTTKQGQVFYIAGEGHNGLARRVEAWLKERNQSDNHIPIRFSTGAINFIDENISEQVRKEVESLKNEHGAPALIVIDTVARNFGAGDENSTSDMGAFVKNVDSLRRENECVVLLIHHTGKKEKNQGRGSSALKGAMDFEFKVEKKEGFNVSLRCTKMKDAEEPPETWFDGRKVVLDDNLQIDSLVFDKVDSPMESQTIGDQIFELIQDLADLKTGQVKRSELNSLANDEGINPNTYRSCLARLKKEGKIYVKDDQDGDIILRME
jgi:hypothetical protein